MELDLENYYQPSDEIVPIKETKTAKKTAWQDRFKTLDQKDREYFDAIVQQLDIIFDKIENEESVTELIEHLDTLKSVRAILAGRYDALRETAFEAFDQQFGAAKAGILFGKNGSKITRTMAGSKAYLDLEEFRNIFEPAICDYCIVIHDHVWKHYKKTSSGNESIADDDFERIETLDEKALAELITNGTIDQTQLSKAVKWWPGSPVLNTSA